MISRNHLLGLVALLAGFYSSASSGAKFTAISHAQGATQYTWTFSCGGGECLSGTFIGGDYWIAPKQAGEQVVLVSATTSGADAGLEINPSLTGKQGFLPCLSACPSEPVHSAYDPALNKAGSLPLAVAPDQSLVKATQKASGCPVLGSLKLNNGATTNCCIDSYDVVTVLASAPLNHGKEAFRPGFAGTTKKVYYLGDFNFASLPHAAPVSAVTSNLTHEWGDDSFSAVSTRWFTPYVDHYMQGLGDAGRLFVPLGTPGFTGKLGTGYGAALASAYLGNMIRRAMGAESWETKKPAVTGLLQRGIDLWASYNAGIRWPSGAGQQLGRKPPIAFFAALVKDPAIKARVRSMAANGNDDFHEDGQVQVRAGGVPVWGDGEGICKNQNAYWGQLFAAHRYDGSAFPPAAGGDNVKTCADPYGYIDGPAGFPGVSYMQVSAGPLIGFQVAMGLMPDLCAADNDVDLSSYTRRLVQRGLQTLPDKCAGPDIREPSDCNPYAHARCSYYGPGGTWGPDGAGGCIAPNGKTTVRRFASINNTPIAQILYEPAIARILRGGVSGSTYMNLCN